MDFWQSRAERCIAQEGALTNSKRPSCMVRGAYPTHFSSGHGPHLRTPGGQSYLDYICALGTCILGYSDDYVNTAIRKGAASGILFSLASTHEVEFAEKIKEIFPFIEKIKILKSGSEGCAAALTIARAYQRTKNNRSVVLSAGYHGYTNEFTSLKPPAHGVVVDFPIATLRDFGQLSDPNIAAVIVEPVELDCSDARKDWLLELRSLCDKFGILLIFDETITALRVPGLSVASMFGITPDLFVAGKALANGMPISIVGGKAEIMESCEYFISTTFAGEILTFNAALATINVMQNSHMELWETGLYFAEKFNSLAPEIVKLEGYATRGTFIGDPYKKALFFQEACNRRILFGPSWFIGLSHTKDIIDVTISECKKIMNDIKKYKVELYGEIPKSPFSEKIRGR